MSKNIYVGNLSFQTTADDLTQVFGEYGTVSRSQVVSDRETGRSRGFGFVKMSDGGDEAIAALNGAEYQGRALTVNEAKPREDRARSVGSAGRGGYGGGRGGHGGAGRYQPAGNRNIHAKPRPPLPGLRRFPAASARTTPPAERDCSILTEQRGR